MTLQILSTFNEPVNESPKVEKQLKANQILHQDFKGELSSSTGIQSKGLYITKFHPLSSEPETPIVTIISTHYFHIDPTKVQYAPGVYGKTWMRTNTFSPIEQGEDDDSPPYFRIGQ